MDTRRKWFREPLALKLFLFVLALVLGVLVPAAYFLANRHLESSLELKRSETYRQGQLMATTLEYEMLENRRDLIRQLIQGFSIDPKLKRLLIVNHEGKVRLTNDSAFIDRVFSRDSPTCQVCHAFPASRRPTSALIDLEGGTVLRSVYPLRNQPMCHRCHSPSLTVNGVMIMDTDVTDLRPLLESELKGTVALVGIIGIVLLAGVTLIVRLLVLRRLQLIETVARAMTEGDFSRRVEVRSADAVGRLGGEFNAMADSVTDLLSQLHHERTQLENVMNSVDDGLLVVDRTFTVVAMNQALARRTGDVREDVLFRRCFEIWTPHCDCSRGESDERCAARACFATGRVHKSFRTRYTRDGVRVEEEVFASPIVDARGEVEQVVEVWRDITERKSHEARMAEFHRLVSLGMLASGFSHEVNTPLATMLLHMDEVRRFADGGSMTVRPQALAEHLDFIRDEILRCRGITQRFLQLSRGQSIRQEILEIPVVVKAILPLVAHVARDAGVSVRVVGTEPVPVVMANGGAVLQVLLNILLNAVQASRPGGEVRVGWQSNSATWIRIEDDGVGMTPDVRDKVFEPFFSQRPSGTGLGLFVSLNLVRQWGGDLRVTSEPDRGSTFEIAFPHAEGACLITAC